MITDLKFICTTSNAYHHLLKISCYLFNKNIGSQFKVDVVGYDKPDFELPENFTFISLGEQIGGPSNFCTDLKKYFEKQDEYFLWYFDDSFFKSIDFKKVEALMKLMEIPNTGRINLSYASRLQDHFTYGEVDGYEIIENTQTALYRVCTQPSIWRKEFLLKYMKDGFSCWDLESQPSFNDGYRIFGLRDSAIYSNEGVTRHDIYDYNLSGIPQDQIDEMEKLGYLKDRTIKQPK